MAMASTDNFWEDNPEEKIKKKVVALKTNFYMGCQLQIKHLPRDVTEDEIRELLYDFPVKNVYIMSSSTGSSMARAVIEDYEVLEDWNEDRVFLLRGQCVPISLTRIEKMLCIARLPFTYTEDQFTILVRPYGEVRRHFLMISEKTGESKGYGFVEYTTNECALQAKNLLDKKKIDGWDLVCDWVDSCHVTFESLYSKCLFVDCLPRGFHDMSEFRKIFSTVVYPPYCQIALKNGCPQDWGLVEYNNWEDAESALTLLNGYYLRGQKIRISYYIPGVHAMNLYLKLLNDPGPKVNSSGLLPDPSGQLMVQSLQVLFRQNPIFAEKLQNIILEQRQASKNGELIEGQKKIHQGQGTANGPNISKNGHGPGGKLFQNDSEPDGWKPVPQAAMLGDSLTNNSLHVTNPPPTPEPSPPPQFLKPVPPQKIPLLPNPVVAHPPKRRLSLSPQTGETTLVTLQEESQSAYWAGHVGHVPGGKMFQNSSMLNGWKPIPQAATPEQPLTNNSLHVMYPPLTPGPSPPQFLKPVPSPKIPLLPNLGVSPPPTRRHSLSPSTGKTTPVTLQEKSQSAYWAGLLNHVHSGPPPAGTHSNFAAPSPTITIHPQPARHPFSIPPPNCITENTYNTPVEIQYGISNYLNNPQNLQQILTNLNPLPVPAPPFSHPFNPVVPAIDPTWAVAPLTPQHYYLPCSLLTSPMSLPVVNNLEIKSPPPPSLFPAAWGTAFFPSHPTAQPLFSPFSAPGLIWPQPSTSIITSLQTSTPIIGSSQQSTPILDSSQPSTPIIASLLPNPLMMPIGQKRRLLLSGKSSSEGNYIGQHSQGIRGHYENSNFKRKKTF